MSTDTYKQLAAEAALEYVQSGMVVGVGTGSTANFFIDSLAGIKSRVDGTVASSEASAQRLKAHGLAVLDLNAAGPLPLRRVSAIPPGVPADPRLCGMNRIRSLTRCPYCG